MSASSRANIEITASSNRLTRGLATAQAKVRGWAAALARGMGNVKFKMPGFGKNALSHFGGNLMTKGFDSLVAGAEDVRNFERGLTRFGIAARQTPAQLAMLRSSIDEISDATGVSRDEVLAGARAYVDLAGASAFSTDKLRLLTNVTQATGAEIGDVATTVYGLGDALKIPDTDMEATLSGLINQSKDGAVHFNQLAEQVTKLAPRFARFGVLGREGAIQFGAMFQVMRPGFKDADEAATGMEGMLRGIILHAKNFEDAGVKIYKIGPNGQKMLLPALQILTAIGHSKLAKDPTLLVKAFGRGEGEQAYQMWSKHLDLFNQLVEAGQKATTVQEDLAAYTQSDAGKIDKAFNSVKLSIAEAFTPERIQAFANALVTAAGYFSTIVSDASTWISAVGHMFGGGGGKDVEVNSALQDLFLNNTVMPGIKNGATAQTEASAIANAKDIIANPQKYANTQWAHDYGGTQGLVAAAKKYLDSEGYVMTPAGPDNTAFGRTYKNKGPDVDLKKLQASLDHLAGVITKLQPTAPATHVKVDVGRDKIVDGARTSSRHATGVSHG